MYRPLRNSPGEISRDVKYIDDLNLFIAVAVGNRFSSSSFINVWKSFDGISFVPVQQLHDYLPGFAHNVGISGTRDGHIHLNKNNFVGYAYGQLPVPNEPVC